MSAGVSCQSRSKASAAAKWRGSRRERPTGGVTASPSSESDKTTKSGPSVNSSFSPARGGSEAQEGPGCGEKDGGGRTPDGPEGGAGGGGGPETQEGPARGVPDAGVGGRTGVGSEGAGAECGERRVGGAKQDCMSALRVASCPAENPD